MDLYQVQGRGKGLQAVGLQAQHAKYSALGCLTAATISIWVQHTAPTYQAPGVRQVELDPCTQCTARQRVLQLWLAVLASPEAQVSGLNFQVSAVHRLVSRAVRGHMKHLWRSHEASLAVILNE